MNTIREECIARKITRICHLTPSRNLAHMFDDPIGLCSTQTLKKYDKPYNPTDKNRYDGRDDMICCSIEFPNTKYLAAVRNREHPFLDWVVLLIDHSYLWHPDSLFCPCNAALDKGRYIQDGILGFQSLYGNASPRIEHTRSPTHLPSAPTDIQAEVLLKDPIPFESITGITVESEEQAQREIFRLKLQKIPINIPIYISPDLFKTTKLQQLIQGGVRTAGRIHKTE